MIAIVETIPVDIKEKILQAYKIINYEIILPDKVKIPEEQEKKVKK